MVWPYCSTKLVLGRALLPFLPPGTPLLENGIITFQAVLKPLSLNPNNWVAAVMLENEALLSMFFIVHAAIMAHGSIMSNSQ